MRRWVKIGSGVAFGVVTLLSFFALLTVLYNFEIVDISGDIECEGSFENPCLSEFDIRNPNPYFVDIYSKDQVKLDFSPNIYDYALFVKDGRCKSVTGVCACELKDERLLGFVGWRCVDFTNKTKPRKDKVYNFRFPAYTTKHFMLAGLKNNPEDKIKWGIGVSSNNTSDYLDPVWLPEKISEIEYNLTSVIIESGFGGKIITQLEIDEDYPCYLQSDGSSICPVIKSDKLVSLNKKYDTSKGIPKVDLRKPEYEVTGKEIIKVDGKDIEIDISEFSGYETTYLDYNVEQIISAEENLNGEICIGFDC